MDGGRSLSGKIKIYGGCEKVSRGLLAIGFLQAVVYNKSEGFNYVNGEPQLSELVLDNQETPTTFAAMKYTLFGYLPHRRDQTRLMPAYSESQLESLVSGKTAATVKGSSLCI